MKMEQIECSETSAYNNQTQGKYPKEYTQKISLSVFYTLKYFFFLRRVRKFRNSLKRGHVTEMSRTPAVHVQRVGIKGSESERKKTKGAMPSVLHFLFTFLGMSRSKISGNLLSRAEDIYCTSHREAHW